MLKCKRRKTFIAQVQAAKDKAHSTLASLEGLGASSEAVTDVGHAVGAERYIDGGQHMSDLSESGRAGLHAIIDHADELIAQAENLKTAGPGAAPATSGGSADSGTQPSTPQYEVTTGADPKPNPIHATPAHTREPSRKIGDPVKPVETEIPESSGSRRRRFARKLSRDADDMKDFTEEVTEPFGDLFGDNFDPWGSEVRTETQTTPTFQAPPPPHETGPQDFVGSMFMLGVLVFDAGTRIFKGKKRDDG